MVLVFAERLEHGHNLVLKMVKISMHGASNSTRRLSPTLKSKRKGHKEDFNFEELEAAIELYKEHEEEEK